MSFADLKRNRRSDIAQLSAAAEKASGGSVDKKDDRFWSPTVDKAGNGYAVIRFLPAPSGENLPWVRYWDHGFKGPTGRWYIENSLTSIGQTDPVGEINAALWNSGLESDKEIARSRKRRLHYVSNILVISDPANPANDGKVFLFKFGKKIFDKILDKMQPKFPDEAPIDPFNFWEGCNLKLKIHNVEGYRNYDKSQFDNPSALFGGDEAKLEAVYNSLNSLSEFLDPKNYKSYDELKAKLTQVLGDLGPALKTAERIALDEKTDAPARKSAPAPAVNSGPIDDDGDESDTLSYFAKLAKED